MADGQVNVPIIGETNKSTLFIAGLAGVTALGWAWWKQRKQSKTAAQNQANAATTPGANGYGYGYGYGAFAYEPYGYGYGPFGLGSYGGQGEYGYGYYGAGSPVNEEVPAAAATNAQWSEAAMTALTSAGWSGSDVLTALGLYLTGAPVSATQASIVQAAIAAEGYPPAPGASGYPPAINQSVSSGQGGSTPPVTGTNVTVPNVVGYPQDDAFETLANAGLHATGTKIIPGKILWVHTESPKAGSSVARGTTVTLTSSAKPPIPSQK